MGKKFFSIAIDGPAGAGKTTAAKILAKKLGITYVDTGALYRAFAVHYMRAEEESGTLLTVEQALSTFSVAINRDNIGEQHIVVNGEDITSLLRTPEVSKLASDLSAEPAVRDALLNIQRHEAEIGNVVMEGRDIGSVVLPNATVKFYLDANLLVRAYRRYKDLVQAGESPDPLELAQSMAQRDYNDSHRATSPLVQVEDAVYIDSSDMPIEDVVYMLSIHTGLVNERTAKKAEEEAQTE